ncbi:MAG: putative toxin-antitoxin system toxin component, PIN family, partial [Chitinispirillaceae bacterium]|nr:putative toxin-antitoxin system toxin component, PIN family [Chitinispirillaceae bacterium]
MLIVVDTNVIVSALLNPHGTPAAVLRLVLQEKVAIGIDPRIMSEYGDVLQRPRFQFDPEKIKHLIEFLEDIAVPVTALPFSISLVDPDDLPFAEVALWGNAEFLVTGNTNHFPGRIGKTAVVLPARFIDR